MKAVLNVAADDTGPAPKPIRATITGEPDRFAGDLYPVLTVNFSSASRYPGESDELILPGLWRFQVAAWFPLLEDDPSRDPKLRAEEESAKAINAWLVRLWSDRTLGQQVFRSDAPDILESWYQDQDMLLRGYTAQAELYLH